MAQYIHYRDPNSQEIRSDLEKIVTRPGTCIFMDINKSTDMKYSGGLPDWGRKLNNTFNVLLYANHLERFIIKGIGDEMMLYIPDDEMHIADSDNSYYALLENIYAALYLIRFHRDPDVFLQCKVSVHYCSEAYNITFFENANDYYGKDIDLTARLMKKAVENRIVLSEVFYRKALEDLCRMKRNRNEGCMAKVSRKRRTSFKGVPEMKEYRVLDVL